MAVIGFIKNHKKVIAGALILVLIGVGAYLLYEHLHPAQPVTTESQEQAETQAGVETAADNAQVPISTGQAQEAAQQIKYIVTSGQQPQYVVYTTAAQAPAAEKTAQEKASADFAIVTDPANPAETVDTSKLPADTQISLNQYNVQAYKKILHTVSYAPKAIDDPSPKEIGYSVAKKITKDGKYLGVGVDYNFDNKATIVKLEYTW
ncbi:hypothetical protein [Pectinatus haikarae]|uniref:Uncharacterized protein YpmB n=1 Tax=Pectinatus haikarae TaxID=349096 RepID=A0ABT9Y3R3_9FIRM|nr:hypothetical protein [Pectinatus haikarae]MDQ0202457.1 uncharacterized protein YpmB [Pectinatus haikarae]